MQQLAYISTATSGMDSGEVFRIVETSARRNPSRDITGFLIFDGQEFLQVVEGPEKELDSLLDALRRDERHGNIRVIDRSTLTQRRFERWRMKRIVTGGADGEASEILARLSEQVGDQDVSDAARRLLKV